MRRIPFLLPLVAACAPATLPRIVADPFGLRTSWASAFAPIAARRTTVSSVAALRSAVARGGTVHVAAGEYDLSSRRLELRPGTVVEGDGMGRTVLVVGSLYTDASPPPSGEYGISLFGAEIGLRRLTIRNANASARPSTPLRVGAGKSNDRNFWDEVEFQLGNGLPVSLMTPTDALIRDCLIRTTALDQSPLRLSGATRLRFEHNRVEYRRNRVAFNMMTDCAIVDSDFTFDGDDHTVGSRETGGLELSYASNVDVKRNRITETGNPTSRRNDGEMIMTQTSNVAEYYGAGRIVRAAGLAVETDLSWGDDPWLSVRHPRTRRKAIYVLTGPGAGQWRWATPGAADGRVRIDRAWDVAPEAGDQVAVGSVTAYRLRVRDNTIRGGKVGINVYSGGIEVSVVGNRLVNAGALVLRSDSRPAKGRTPHSTLQHNPLIDAFAEDNSIRSEAGNPAALAVVDLDAGTGLPLGMLRVRATDNTIVGRDRAVKGNVGGFDGVQVESIPMVRGVPVSDRRLVDVVVRDNAVSGGRTMRSPERD